MKIFTSVMLVSVLAALPVSAQSTHSTAVVLSEGVSQAEIDAQVRANIAAGRAAYQGYAEAGGCNADFLPVTIAAYCFNRGADANPTGGQLGSLGSNGSDGGSDGSDGGAE